MQEQSRKVPHQAGGAPLVPVVGDCGLEPSACMFQSYLGGKDLTG